MSPRVTGGAYGPNNLRRKTRRQYHEAPHKVLRTVTTASEQGFATFAIRVRTPSSQARVKISVNFEPAANTPPNPDITTAGNTIWLAAADDAVGGAASTDIPNSSVVGTRAAPIPFPSTPDPTTGVPTPDAGLLGYSREFVTAADWIVGEVGLGAPTGIAGAYILKVSVQPDGVVLPEDAWAEITDEVRAFSDQIA